METFPWSTHRIHVLTVERPKPSLVSKLHQHGYRHHCNHATFGDQLWVHEEWAQTAQARAEMPPRSCRD